MFVASFLFCVPLSPTHPTDSPLIAEYDCENQETLYCLHPVLWNNLKFRTIVYCVPTTGKRAEGGDSKMINTVHAPEVSLQQMG